MRSFLMSLVKKILRYTVKSKRARTKICHTLALFDSQIPVTRLHRLIELVNDFYFSLVVKPHRSTVEYVDKHGLERHPPLAKDKTTATRIIILAAGEGERWNGKQIKQLATVNGKPLIENTLQLCPDAVVISHQKSLHKYPHAIPTMRKHVLETLLSTRPIWSKRTIVLLGDVVYNPRDLNKIKSFQNDFSVFGSRLQGEIFALSFSNEVAEQVTHHLTRALTKTFRGARAKIWDFYHCYIHSPYHKQYAGQNFIELFSTRDIDTLDDYDRLIGNLPPKSHPNLFKTWW